MRQRPKGYSSPRERLRYQSHDFTLAQVQSLLQTRQHAHYISVMGLVESDELGHGRERRVVSNADHVLGPSTDRVDGGSPTIHIEGPLRALGKLKERRV